MATCSGCGGAAYLPSGRYESCYSCGGSGHGSHTDVSCMSCGGSGQSSTEVLDPCWKCYGTGTQADPKPERQYTKPQPTPVKPQPKSKATAQGIQKANTANANTKAVNNTSETISGIAFVLAIIAAFFALGDSEDFGTAFGVGALVFGMSWVALYVAIEVLKFVFELVKVLLQIGLVIGFIAVVIYVVAGG